MKRSYSMKETKKIRVIEQGFNEDLKIVLSTFPEKTIYKDDSVTVVQVNNPYLLVNDKWNIHFIGEIKQFKELVSNYSYANKNIYFRFTSPTINSEVKYVYYQQLFNDLWTISSIFNAYQFPLNKMAEFLNKKYSELTSLLDLDIDKVEREYLFWLNENEVTTHRLRQKIIQKDSVEKTPVAGILRRIYNMLFQHTDNREEFEKDKWDVRVLHDKYGVEYNKSKSQYNLNFSKFDKDIREQIKKYIKQRLLSKNKFSWCTAQNYLTFLPMFFTFVFSLEPTWTDLKALNRTHIVKYIDLYKYAKNNLKRRNSKPEQYVNLSLIKLQKYLEDIQRYEYEMAPEIPVQRLIFPDDKPKIRKKSIDQIDYIPDYVLEQLFNHINDLHKDFQPVVWIAFKTGLRISDVLGLTFDCLVKLNGQYYIETDIEKTYVKGHRIPIDDELADIVAVMIDISKELSNQDNNPEGYIFVRYRGQRKGKHIVKVFFKIN